MSPEILKTATEVAASQNIGEVPKFEDAEKAVSHEGMAEGGDENIPSFDQESGLDDAKGDQSEENRCSDLADAPSGEAKDMPDAEAKDVSETRKNGGTYGELTSPDQWGGHLEDPPPHEVHHMPADSVNGLERNDGPAIVMEKGDHRQTASCGNSVEAREYREKQKELIDEGKFDEAMQMDIDDIHEKFGDKYDDAIAEMKSEAEEKGLI